MSGREIGRVAEMWRYPVKSMAGERLDEVEVGWHGLSGDRRRAFIRDGLVRSGFPWLTIRERPEMGHYRPHFADPSRPDDSRTLVRTPSGDEYDVVDPALATELGHGARLIKQDVGVFDTMPLSLITTRTIATLGTRADAQLDVRRFRPNLLVEPTPGSGEAGPGDADDRFPEDGWVGRTLRIGELEMRVDQRDQRCVMVNVDPDTTERDASILRTIARERQACLGVYGTIVKPGRVSVGDPVALAGWCSS